MTATAPLHPALDPECFDEPSARDERFTLVDLWDECAMFPDGHPEKMQEFLHRQMNEEVAVLENAARSLAEFPDAPWELRMWLARQCADEARHAINYQRIFVRRGGRIGQYPVLSFQYRILGKIRHMVGRLAVQNRTFEADGLDAVTHAIEEARAGGDDELLALYDAQQADEVVHIRFGNEWIKKLVAGRPAELMAMGRSLALAAKGFKQVFQPGGGTRVSKYGVAEDLREQAGFSREEIAAARTIAEARRERVRRGRGLTSPAGPTESARLLSLLRRSGTANESDIVGDSMSPAIPAGATVRIRRNGLASAREGGVVAIVLGGALSVHRLIHVGRSARARGWVICHGDNNLTCDAPLQESDVVGIVEAVRLPGTETWESPAPARRHRRLRETLTGAVNSAVRLALEVHPRLARWMKGVVVAMMTPIVWLRPYEPGRAPGASVAHRRPS